MSGGGLVASVSVKGGEQLVAALQELDRKVQRSIGGKALRAGARLIRDAAQNTAPKATGRLSESIKVRTSRSRTPGTMRVEVQTSKGFFKGDDFYAGFVELGHFQGKRTGGKLARLREREGRKAGRLSGRKWVPGEHYLKYSFDEMKQQAADAVVNSLREQIYAAVGK